MATLPNLGVSHMVKASTSTVAQVFTSTSSALDMFSNYIENAKHDQKIDHAIHREKYAAKAIERAALEEAERILELDEFSSKSDRHHELLTASMAKYHKLIHGEAPKSVETQQTVESE